MSSCACDHWTERREESSHNERRKHCGTRRRAIECALKRVTESTRRIKTMHVTDALPFFPMTNVAERESESTRALVRVERDAVIAKEPTTDFQWIEILASEIFVLPSTSWLLFDARQEWLEPRWCLASRLHRSATLARAISG